MQTSRGLYSLILGWLSPALAWATAISSLHNAIEIQNPAQELAVNEIYELVSDAGVKSGLIVITKVDGPRARADVIQGNAMVGQFLRNRHYAASSEAKHSSASVATVEHYVTFANTDLTFHPGELYRMAPIAGKEAGLIIVTEANSSEAQASVLSGDPEPGEKLRDREGDSARGVASPATIETSLTEDIANQVQPSTPRSPPPPIVKRAPDHRYKLGLGIASIAPSATGLTGSSTISNQTTIALAGLYNYDLEQRDYTLEFGLILNEQKYTVTNSVSSLTTKVSLDNWYAGLPVEVKYNMLSHLSSSELRFEAGALYNLVLSAKATGTQTSTFNGRSITSTSSTDAKPKAPIDLNLGLEYVLNAKENLEFWADLRYYVGLGSDKSLGPMLLVGTGF